MEITRDTLRPKRDCSNLCLSDGFQLESGNRYKQQAVKTAVLNKDDASYDQLAAIPASRQLTFGLQEGSNVSASDIVFAADNTHFRLMFDLDAASGASGSIEVSSSLAGEFNVYNMLAAATASSCAGRAG